MTLRSFIGTVAAVGLSTVACAMQPADVGSSGEAQTADPADPGGAASAPSRTARAGAGASDRAAVNEPGKAPESTMAYGPGVQCGATSCSGTNAFCCASQTCMVGAISNENTACGGADRKYCDETSDCAAGTACCTTWPLSASIKTYCQAPEQFFSYETGSTYQGCPATHGEYETPGPQACNPAKTGECLVPGATCVADSSGKGWCRNPAP